MKKIKQLGICMDHSHAFLMIPAIKLLQQAR